MMQAPAKPLFRQIIAEGGTEIRLRRLLCSSTSQRRQQMQRSNIMLNAMGFLGGLLFMNVTVGILIVGFSALLT